MRTPDPSKGPRIIDAAGQLFSERPYHEVRMDDIAGRAGVAKGTLYLHFRDKEALYLALIEDGMRRQLCDVLGRVKNVSDPLGKIGFIIRALVEFFDRYPYFLELIPTLDLKSNQSAGSPLRPRREEFVAMIREVLDELSGTGRLAVDDPGFSAIVLGGLIHEVLKSTPRPWPAELAGRIEGQFLHGVRGRPVADPSEPPPQARPRSAANGLAQALATGLDHGAGASNTNA